MISVYTGSNKSKMRYNTVKDICIDCIKELSKEYNDKSFYENKRLGFCECCKQENKTIVSRF